MPFPGPGAGQDAPRWKAIRWASRGPSAIVAMIFGKLNRSIRSRCLAHRNQPRVRQAARIGVRLGSRNSFLEIICKFRSKGKSNCGVHSLVSTCPLKTR